MSHEKPDMNLPANPLSAGHQRLFDIIDATELATWEWNVQTGETRFNERWAQMIGMTLAELEPTSIDTWTRLAHPDDLKLSEIRLADHFSGKLLTTPATAECSIATASGSGCMITAG